MLKRDVKIDPMEEGIPRPGKISFGVGSYGVDLRIGYKFYVFTPARCAVVDPKNFDKNAFVEVDITPCDCGDLDVCPTGKCVPDENGKYETVPDHVLIPPNSFVLGETVETVEIPRDCIGIVVGKSTYARCGIGLVCTPIEPEWRGKIVIEIANHTPLPAKVYAGEGIGQLMVFRSDGYREAIVNALRYEVMGGSFGEKLEHVSCEKSYADKKAGKPGRYQNQEGITLPKVD